MSREESKITRRAFVSGTSGVVMVTGLAAGYGSLAGVAGRFLYPADEGEGALAFVTQVDALEAGEGLNYDLPSGAQVTIVRQHKKGDVNDFIALSSECPHLGCRVHWESKDERFFCPCHNGTFDKTGAPTGGPPKKANQHLPRYPLAIEDGLLFIRVPESDV